MDLPTILQRLTDTDIAQLKAGFGGARTVPAETDDGQTLPVQFPQEPPNRFCEQCVALLKTEERRRAGDTIHECPSIDLHGFSDEELTDGILMRLYEWQREVPTAREQGVSGLLWLLGGKAEREAERRGLSAKVKELQIKVRGAYLHSSWPDS
jgi:hypothetical protein